MKILMLSWEYPPLSHGGLARHVEDLSQALVKQGHSLYIITRGEKNISKRETINGVNIIRTDPVKISANNFIDEILHLNFQMLTETFKVTNEIGDIDLIHAHDWLSFWAAKVLKHSLLKPLIVTIHATESGRHQGIYNELQRYINDTEWYACFEAWKVIVCSNYMQREVKSLFQVPHDKIAVIENGVNAENFQNDCEPEFRDKYASPAEDIIFYIGRLVREKGVQVLIQAMPKILQDNPDTKLVVAGKGGFLDNLKSQAKFLGIEDRIYFTGFVSDEERNKLYQAADLAVFPSFYEPFGIVALEGMTTGTPVVVSDVGGMGDFVENGVTGLKVPPNNPYQLAEAVQYILNNRKAAAGMAERAINLVEEEFNWKKIAEKTIKVYQEILDEYQQSEWNKDNYEEYLNKEQVQTGFKYI